ncbi:MAG: hypothetical protein V1686_02825, partial [Patescibacteria group bacterium]
IDTIVGIDKPTIFNDLKNFSPPPRFSTHDFDAYTNLKYLQKLGKIKKVKIIGIPSMVPEKKAIDFTIKILNMIV